MKRLFINTYWAQLETDGGKRHHAFQWFWIWNTPSFYAWLSEVRKALEKDTKQGAVLINCGKV